MNWYLILFKGEPVTRLEFQSDGKANVTTGELKDAILYSFSEACECEKSIGRGAEVVEAP